MYSPDLAPMDFAVFPYIKSFLRGMRFDNLSELRQAVLNVIFHMKTDQFVQIFDDDFVTFVFLAEECRHFSIDPIVALFPGHSSETMFHLWLLFYPKIQFRSG
jgi:hypothetical protein